MDWETLDELINELEREMPPDPGLFGVGVQRSDWGAWWRLAKGVQAGFNSKVRYPSKERRQGAWERFNRLRGLASDRSDEEHSHLKGQSGFHRDVILSELLGIGYSPLLDALFFDRTTVDSMKKCGRKLGEVMRYFSDHKTKMIGEHKKTCYERIQEVKDEQDRFWSDYKEAMANRQNDFRVRAEANIQKNVEKLRNASKALERFRDKASDLRSDIRNSNSAKWITIWGEWLAETEEKISDIEDQITRYEQWIEEDEDKLRN